MRVRNVANSGWGMMWGGLAVKTCTGRREKKAGWGRGGFRKGGRRGGGLRVQEASQVRHGSERKRGDQSWVVRRLVMSCSAPPCCQAEQLRVQPVRTNGGISVLEAETSSGPELSGRGSAEHLE